LGWRQLWRAGAFALLDLSWDSNFSGRAHERGLRFGTGRGLLEDLDLQGALQPIAFAEGGDPPQFVDLTPFEALMTFRAEQPAREWSTYAWDAYGLADPRGFPRRTQGLALPAEPGEPAPVRGFACRLAGSGRPIPVQSARRR
jgi:hypothetical protein